VTELWKASLFNEVWGSRPDPGSTSVFLCGNPTMIDDMCSLLSDEGFREHSLKNPGHIFVERYW
jgi:hypothetical protein